MYEYSQLGDAPSLSSWALHRAASRGLRAQHLGFIGQIMNGRHTTHALACVPRFASGERHFLGFEENPVTRHDSQRLRARASITYEPVCSR
jgi:hypothetical protein